MMLCNEGSLIATSSFQLSCGESGGSILSSFILTFRLKDSSGLAQNWGVLLKRSFVSSAPASTYSKLFWKKKLSLFSMFAPGM